jgi:hypothetical protein
LTNAEKARQVTALLKGECCRTCRFKAYGTMSDGGDAKNVACSLAVSRAARFWHDWHEWCAHWERM